MSAIRPPVPSPLFPNAPAPAPASPARASRSDFFRAALDGTRGAATTALAEKPADTPVASAEPPAFAPSGERPSRPGSLLDIRV